MDLTSGADTEWRDRGIVEAASDEGDDVQIRGDAGPDDLSDDLDAVLAELTADHDVAGYPAGAVIAWFEPGRPSDAVVRAPADVERDPFP